MLAAEVFHGAKWNLPSNFAFAHIDGTEYGVASNMRRWQGWQGFSKSIGPRDRASIDQAVTVIESLIYLRIVCPLLLSRDWIERNHAIEGRGDKQFAGDKNRSAFKCDALRLRPSVPSEISPV